MRFFRRLFVCLLLFGACSGIDPVDPPAPVPKPEPEPEPQARPLHVTSTSFSLGDGIVNPRDSLFINFDGKIVSSTIPHYDWVSDVDYYYPENRVILHDTTLVLVFDGHQADRFGQDNEYGFTVTGEDGSESPVSVKIPFYDHVIHVNEDVFQMSLYNDEKEIVFFAGRKLVRMDYKTGEVIREYEFPDLKGDILCYTENRHNGLMYVWSRSPNNGVDVFPEIYALNPESGELWLALAVPEKDGEIYQFREPVDLAFTKYGSGIVILSCKGSSGSHLGCIKVVEDGTLVFEEMAEYQDYESEYTFSNILYYADWLAESQDGTFVYCVTRGWAYYYEFNGETCRLEVGYCGPDQKMYTTPNKKNGIWLMRELYSQYLLYPDGTTSPAWHLDGRHEGGADFCYTPGYEHLIITFERQEFHKEAARVQMIDTASGDLVFSKSLLQDQQEFQTTSDGKYGIAYRDDFGYGKDTRIFVYDMPVLLSRCRFGGK